jgi:hypothetical protein
MGTERPRQGRAQPFTRVPVVRLLPMPPAGRTRMPEIFYLRAIVRTLSV